MLHFPRWKVLAILATCLAGLLFALPNFFARDVVKDWPSFVPKAQMPLGLDLQGGAHLLLAADSEQLRKDWLTSLREDARKTLRAAVPTIYPGNITISGNVVRVPLVKPEEADRALTELRGKLVQQIGNAIIGTSAFDVDVTKSDGGILTITPTEAGFVNRQSSAITASIDTINRRINALGTAESTVVRQGRDRILVQFPGLKDTAELKSILGKTAKLSFHEVSSQFSPEDFAQGRVPSGYRVYPSKDGYIESYLLRDLPIVQGEELTDAQPGQRDGGWVINFRFNTAGGRKFGNYTRDNIGRPFAIVLDNEVISAPEIRGHISGGSGEISGRFTAESAATLSLQLRSGALPTDLTIVEERTVGPSLGADSVAAGKLASIVGGVATAAMTIFAYGTFGIFAVIALLVNGLLIAAIMSAIGMTLTLPGIAGLVLTIGMAVDANVLIYERIREEIRAGKTAISAIDAGFSRAMVTIIDSQLTTLAAALLMFWLGSGPIRGFAITLSIGIFTSVFTAVTVTRLLVVWWLHNQKERANRIAVPI